MKRQGYPTWQIDPRQPRAIDNVLETADGRYMIVDLESGLVSPLASLKTWWRAIRRGMVPIYDDVYFDVTRAYVAAERSQMQAALGDAWLAELDLNLAQAEAATTAWHGSEPRIWSRTLTAAWHGFYVRSWPERIQARVDGGQQKATEWLTGAVAAWQADGRIDAGQSERLRAEIASPAVQAVLPHFGAHFVITVVLRFPFGSIARFAWSLWGLSSATVKLLLRKLDRQELEAGLGGASSGCDRALCYPGLWRLCLPGGTAGTRQPTTDAGDAGCGHVETAEGVVAALRAAQAGGAVATAGSGSRACWTAHRSPRSLSSRPRFRLARC